jgi:hypothetical protein
MVVQTTVLWIDMESCKHGGHEPSSAIKSYKQLNSLATTSFIGKLLHYGVGTCASILSVSQSVG